MEKVEGTFPLRAMSMNHRDGKKELTHEVGVNDEQTGVDMKKRQRGGQEPISQTCSKRYVIKTKFQTEQSEIFKHQKNKNLSCGKNTNKPKTTELLTMWADS